jgi:GH15 family glucan-1,4-alpha-glucosidase
MRSLQAVTLRLLPVSDPHALPTVQAIRDDLDDGGWLKRYRTDDGFGTPTVAFALCTFWLVEALARLGLEGDARTALDRVRTIRSPLGLLSEDVMAASGEMWGNFPQAYSHVGQIHAAFAAAPRWGEYGS